MNRLPPERDAVRFALGHARRHLWRLIRANESAAIMGLPAA